MEAKRLAAEKAVEYIKEGMTVGLGTGSTAYWAIHKLGERVKEGLKIQAVASSNHSEQLAKELNIPICSFSEISAIDITIDGADEVDKNHNLIKGGGGALLREKILAANTRHFIVIVDESKLVQYLGKFPLPVEIVPFASPLTIRQLENLGCKTKIRQSEGAPFITDNGNLIIDCYFDEITAPSSTNTQLHLIPGVVETGIFTHSLVGSVIVGYADGTIKEIKL